MELSEMKNIGSRGLLSGIMKKPEHKVTTNLQDKKEENPVARRERLHESSTDQRKINPIKNTIEGIMKKPEHKVTTNLQNIKEGNPVARQKSLHETHKVQENEISTKDTIEENKKNPEYKVTRNPLNNRRTVHQFKKRFESDNKNNVKKERYTPEIKRARLRLREMMVEHKETNLEPDDHMNQEDKEVQNDVVINEKLGLETVPIKAKAKKKKNKRRRLKNSLPCNINKVYIMKLGTLSKKEYKQQCKSKSMKCKQNITCHVHEGRRNLKKLKFLISFWTSLSS